jgi:hypothetical protein
VTDKLRMQIANRGFRCESQFVAETALDR